MVYLGRNKQILKHGMELAGWAVGLLEAEELIEDHTCRPLNVVTF